jgi:hypothetical protein
MKSKWTYPVLASIGIITSLLFRESIVDLLNIDHGRTKRSNEINSQELSSRKGKSIERKETYAEVLERQKRTAVESVNKQLLEAQAKGGGGPYMFRLFASGGGRLTTGASEAAELTEEERLATDTLVRDTWKRAGEDFASRAKLDTSSDKQNGLYIYDIPARSDRGKDIIDGLEGEIKKAVGEKKQKIITKGVEDNDCFGSFGRYDVRIEFNVRDGTYRYKYTDTQTGKAVADGEATMEHFQELFGTAFDFDD